MKTITIKGKEFQYQQFASHDYDGSTEYTDFYDGTVKETKKKYWFFGPEIISYKPKFVFRMNFLIEDSSVSKEELIKKLNQKVYRMNEIAKGELI